MQPPTADLKNASRATAADLASERSATTFVIRAQNSGDMYHVRAAMIARPGYALVIWNVDPATRNQAQQVVDLHDDLIRAGRVVRYAGSLPEGFGQSETDATEHVERYFKEQTMYRRFMELQKLQKEGALTGAEKTELAIRLKQVKRFHASTAEEQLAVRQKHYAQVVAPGLADAYGAYTDQEAQAFAGDLRDRGRFTDGGRYVIVPFRATGHSDRPGANAPALDTGLEGMQQIIAAVRRQLGPSVDVVPMGEEPAAWKGPNLLNYWTWPSAPGRRRQLSLLKYLSDTHEVIGAVGMRSGVLDQLAFAGIRVLSIDISPHRRDGGNPQLAPSKGWSRGLKMERVYGRSYGRVFLHEPREDERKPGVPAWKGAFGAEDNKTLEDAVAFYFGKNAGNSGHRHSSHPLAASEVAAGLSSLPPIGSFSAYALVESVQPYLRELNQHRAELSAGLRDEVGDRLDQVTARLDVIHGIARGWDSNHFVDAPWLSQNRSTALIDNVPGPAFDRQLAKVAEKMGAPPTERALRGYLYCHQLYQRSGV